MRDNIERNLKRWLKRKVKVTLALVTIFLITGSIGYGIDIDGNSTDGRVQIEDGTYNNIYGKKDYHEGEEAINNVEANSGEVTILGGTAKNIYGGFAENNNPNSDKKGDAKALNNKITIKNIDSDVENIIGGHAFSISNSNCGNTYANENSILIENSTIKNGTEITGGYTQRSGGSSKDGQANRNRIEINNSIIYSEIYGGEVQTYSAGNGSYPSTDNKNAIIETIGNEITINETTIGEHNNKEAIYGSYIYSHSSGNTAKSQDNIVNFNNSIMYGNITGTYIQAFNNSTGNKDSNGTNIVLLAKGNQVNISNSKVYKVIIDESTEEIYGDIIGAYAYDDNNYSNVTTDGKQDEQIVAKLIVEENEVKISENSYIEKDVFGGRGYSRGSYTGYTINKMSNIEVLKNKVTIEDSEVGKEENKSNIFGGYGYSLGYGRYKEAGDVFINNNIITIKGNSKIYADICGGCGISQGGDLSTFVGGKKGDGGNVYANENQVIIDGATINGDIYGAYAETSDTNPDGTISHRGKLETNNNIVTIKGNSNIENSNLYGSNLTNDKTTGNKLVIDDWSGKVNSVNNFNSIEFKNINWNNNGIVLDITNGENSLKNTDIGLISIKSGVEVNNGDSMYFVKSENNLGTDKNKITLDENFTLGLGLQGTGELIVEENGNVLYKIGEVGTSEQVNLLAENRTVSLAFINQGGDLINQALNSMKNDTNYGFKSFFATQGNRSKYDVNSDIKINGWSIVAGLGKTEKIYDKNLDWAVFYEDGIGNYRTYNTFNQEIFNGSGELEYRGVGIAGRYYYNDEISIESSIRLGNLSTEMNNALMDINKNMYDFDFDTLYYACHIGINRNTKLSQNKDLDIYGKYSYAYTDGDNINLDNQNFKFDSAKSNKIDLGIRVNENKYKNINLYYGLAFEYEFDGKAYMSIDKYSVPTQSLKGDIYVAEIGLKYGTEDSPWNYDINIHGYIGEREGITGTLNITYNF